MDRDSKGQFIKGRVPRNRTDLFIVCPTCKTSFRIKPSHAYRRRFCSRECKRLTPEMKAVISNTQSKPLVLKECLECKETYKVFPSVEKSRGSCFCSRVCYLVYAKKGGYIGKKPNNVGYRLRGTDSPTWKGKDVSYRRLHKWVEFNRGKPMKCEHCHKIVESTRFIHWANRSHLYLRDLNDWIRLCATCHIAYDLAYRDKLT